MVVSTPHFEPGHHKWSLTIDGLNRMVRVFVPKTDVPELYPAVIMLPGAGATSAWTQKETDWPLLAERQGFVFVCPDSTTPTPHQPTRFVQNPHVWNDGSGWPPASHVRVDDVRFLRTMIEQLPKVTPTDPRRIYMTGFSNGAAMTFRFAVELPHLLAAIAPVAGHPTVLSPAPVWAVPTLYMIGTLDPLVPLAGGKVDTPWGKKIYKPPVTESLRRWRVLLGCPAEPAWVQEVEGVMMEHFGPGRNGSCLETWMIAGLGHHWPGGKGGLKTSIAGPPSDRVVATESIWQFFKQFSLP